jgi:hypothetical protein
MVNCEKQSVCLTIHRGSEDDLILHGHGAAGFQYNYNFFATSLKAARVMSISSASMP